MLPAFALRGCGGICLVMGWLRHITRRRRFTRSTSFRPSAHFYLREYAPVKTSSTPGRYLPLCMRMEKRKNPYPEQIASIVTMYFYLRKSKSLCFWLALILKHRKNLLGFTICIVLYYCSSINIRYSLNT